MKRFLSSVSAIVLFGCAGSGSYVWINDVPDSEIRAAQKTQVSMGDTVSVRVFGQEPMSMRGVVRDDGMISVPLIGHVRAAGRTPDDITNEVKERLAPYINAPNVMTVIEESHIKITLAGEVRRPGTVTSDGPMDLLTAIANAGGLTEFAADSSIFVLRTTPNGIYRVRFRWDDVSRGVNKAALFRLRDGDQVVVE